MTAEKRQPVDRRPLILASFAFVVAALFAGLLIWRFEEQRLRTLRLGLEAEAASRAHALERSIEEALTPTYLLGTLVQESEGQLRDFPTTARRILPRYKGADAIGIAPGGVVADVYPRVGNEAAIGHDLFNDPERSREALLARDSHQLTLAGPFKLRQGGSGAVGRLPVFLDDAAGKSTFWGLVFVIVRLPEVIEPIIERPFGSQPVRVRLWREHPETGERQVIAETGSAPLVDPVQWPTRLPNGTWFLSAEPVNGWRDSTELAVKIALGLLFSSLVALVARLLAELQSRRAGLETLVQQRTAELRAREADLNRAQSVARVGSWIAEPDGADRTWVMRWSPEAHRLCGLPEAVPLTFETFLAGIHPDDRKSASEAWERLHATGTLDFEFRAVVGASIRWIRCRAARESRVGGGGDRIVGTVQDVHETRRAQERLRESEERLSFALEGSTDGLWDVQLPSGSVYLSARGCEILGYRPDEFFREVALWDQLVHPEDLPRTEKALRSYVAGEIALFEVEQRLRTRDGHWKWIRTRGKAVKRDAAGNPTRMVGTHTDITEQKRSESLLRASLQEKEALLKEVHHRVKNNLQVITSLLRLEIARSDHPLTLAVLQDMKHRIRSMALLHETLYRSGSFASVDLPGYLGSLCHHLSRSIAMTQAGAASFRLDIAPVQLGIDQAAPCGLIVSELATNSLKHAFPEGRGGEIRVSLQRVEPGGRLCLQVSDTGIGLPEDFSVSNSRTLGLQLVSDLVEQLGGTFRIADRRTAAFEILFTPSPEPAPAPAP